MRSFTQLSLSFLVAVCLIGFVGCQDSGKTKVAKTATSHEEHVESEHPHADNYDDAVAELAEMQENIKEGFAEGKAEEAEGSLHDVVHVLENLEKFVRESDRDEEAKKSLEEAIETLFSSYGAIDDKLHGIEGKDYDEVSEQIEAAIKTLQDQVTKTTEK